VRLFPRPFGGFWLFAQGSLAVLLSGFAFALHVRQPAKTIATAISGLAILKTA
jgi:hypothetical protein